MGSKKPIIDFESVIDALENPRERRRLTLVEVLAIRDDAEFGQEIIHYVNDQVLAGRSLRPPERIVYLVNDCEYRLFRGGITDVLIQMSERDEAIDGLGTIGAFHFERVLRRGAQLFQAIPEAEHEQLTTIGDWIERAGSDALDSLNAELGDAEEIRAPLLRWIAAHRTAFAVD